MDAGKGSAIESLQMGCLPVQSLTTYIKSDEADLQIDFVTSMHREGVTPVLIKALNATMQPLKFMEFSMAENDAQALQDAWLDLTGRGPGWLSRAQEGISAPEYGGP